MLKQAKRRLVLIFTVLVLLLIGCTDTGEDKDTLSGHQSFAPTESLQATTSPDSSAVPETSGTPEATATPTATVTPEATVSPVPTTTPEASELKEKSSLEVHFIDCGQGDSILLRSNNETMLIDAGNNKDGQAIVSYLKKQGIEKVDYLVGTHPDADHIGGLDTVINAFNIGKVYIPKKQHTTQTFEDVLTAIRNKGLKISSPTPGTVITLGGAKLTVLGPVNYYDDDNNNNSIVLRADHGKNSFLLTGDAELQEETDIMEAGGNLEATVLKVGHHGSSSSTSRFFLEKVKPKYAVISCGEGNKYGHPHKETLDYLNMYNIKVYRTDLQKTIIMKSDGSKLEISTGNSSAKGTSSYQSNSSDSKKENQVTANTNKDNTSKNDATSTNNSYIGNKNTKKFHVPSCGSLPAEKNRVYFSSRNQAVSQGYAACKRCHP